MKKEKTKRKPISPGKYCIIGDCGKRPAYESMTCKDHKHHLEK